MYVENVELQILDTSTLTVRTVSTRPIRVYGYIGQNVTLVCDLQGLFDTTRIIWHYEDGDFDISSDEVIFPSVPDEIKDRMDVTCHRGYNSRCSLNVSYLTMNDSGTYKCGYYASTTTLRTLLTRFLIL